MENKTQRLELENILSQIYSNNNIFDGPHKVLYFSNINFITLNSIDIYVKDCNISFHKEFLDISVFSATIEIKYSNIDYLSINFVEG